MATVAKWMLFVPMYWATGGLWVAGPRIDRWDPHQTWDVWPNNPESITLK